jgi:hypothetical protein
MKSAIKIPSLIFLVSGALLLTCLLVGPILTITRHIPLNYNEGWNAYLAARAIKADPTLPLYPQPGSMVFNNYPPLSFLLIGFIGHLSGDMIVSGRCVALFSQMSCAFLIACCIVRMGGTRTGAIAGGLLAALYSTISFHGYVAINDPQWLANMIMLGGLTVLLPAEPLSPRRVICAALLIATGGFVKHNLLALPLSISLWLAWKDRRAFLIWCTTGAVAVAGGFLLSTALYGPAFLVDVLHHPRTYSPQGLARGLGKLVELTGLIISAYLILACPATSPQQRSSRLFVTLFLTVALITGLFQRLGAGVTYNAHFETLLAASLGAGLVLSRSSRIAFAALCLSVGPLLALAPSQIAQEIRSIRNLQTSTAEWQDVVTRIRATPGPVACETLALCYWAGKDEEVDFFNLTQAILAHQGTYPFVAIVQRHGFRLIQIDRTVRRQDELSPETGRQPLIDALNTAGYKPFFTGPVFNGPGRIVIFSPPLR